ncbi:hypothetical protein [Streptomyces yerevanensis]|uniref:baeRF2 domain-containing protein n=1 Tax=Streptomyces yerevanensis TaxID=66378 RepID=UPI0005276110|nr:hypothetical protein [Streptomyces yerevanensis]
MKLSFLDPLYSRPGPWASVHLDTSRDIDEPDKAIDLRWRHLRDTLRDQGTDAATVSILDAAVGTGCDLPGRHGQALFAAHGQLVLVADLPDPPVRDTARFDDLPDTLPLAVQRAPDIPYLAVALTRGVSEGKGEYVSVVAESGRWPVSRVAPGPRLSRLVPVEDWPRTAPRIAQELDELAGRHRAGLVVLRRDEGDPWLSGVLVNRMPIHLQNRVTVVESGPGTAADTAPGRPLLETEVARTLDGRLSAPDRLQLDTFLAQRARHRQKSEGVTAAVTALQRGRARALLLTRSPRLPERLWVGAEPSQLALSAEELEAFGVKSVRDRPADAALLYATARTGAELIVVDSDRVPLTDGVGVLLRYREPGDMAAD